MKTEMRRAVAVVALSLSFAAPAIAHHHEPIAPAVSSSPTVGVGLSLSFGQGRFDTGVGIRVFSGNLRNKTVASAGIDYMLGSQRWRGTLGVARLGNNAYIGLDLGLGLKDGTFDYGFSAGGVKTRAPATTLPPVW